MGTAAEQGTVGGVKRTERFKDKKINNRNR